MSVRIILTGHKEIDATLKSLPRELTHKIQQQAHVDAAKPLIEKEKLLAPEGPTGNLIDSIGAVKVPLKRAREIGEVHVGPRIRRPYRGFHGHLVEFGTKTRELEGKGKYRKGTNRGIMPAKPFVKPALQQTRDRVLARIQNSTAKKIVSTMKRNLKQNFIKG